MAVPADGSDSLPRERRVAVPGTRNFRDMGGYVTEDGTKRTRWHRLYRADHLAKAAKDSAACSFLRDQLHVTCAVDLRSVNERTQQPYSIAAVTVYRVPMLAGGDLLQRVQDVPELTEGIVEKLMCDVYGQFVVDAKAEFERFFKLLVDKAKAQPCEEAIVFHCKAGKDRTGVCAALLLLALGVPLETVYEDFLLTNEYYEAPPLKAVKTVVNGEIQPGAVSALFQARRSYLERALDTICQQYQDVPTYMRQALMLSEQDICLLKEAYLEEV